MTATYVARPALDDRFILGEGPVWDAKRDRVLWVDITAGWVLSGRIDDDRIELVDRREFAGTVSAVTVSDDGSLLVAGAEGLIEVASDGRRTPAQRILAHGAAHRLNDGKPDPAGRFLIGTSPLGAALNDEKLVRVEMDGSLTTLDDDLSLSNGLAWSRTTLYSVDSFRNTVWKREYDAATGLVGSRERFVRIEDGWPDGMCIDAEEHVWIAVCGRGQVRRFTPAGELVAVIDVAAPRTTSVAFVGTDLDLLMITTASDELSAEQLADWPDSGRVFTSRVGVGGAPVPSWVPSRPVQPA